MGTFVFAAMGTVVSVQSHVPLERSTEDALLAAFAVLEDMFSLYRPDTEASRFAHREVALRDTSPEFRQVYNAAVGWRALTEGAFTPHRPDGVVDLSGIVKALAIADAGRALEEGGVRDWCINAGGDVLTAGVDAVGAPWVAGVVDPDDRAALVSQAVTGPGRRAVATSGVAERGEHVWRIGADATFCQVTVVAEDIVTADVLATAILAGGPTMLERAHRLADVEVLAWTFGGDAWASPAFRAA